MVAIHTPTAQHAHDPRFVRAMEARAAHARRDAVFDRDAELFGDPAWDILLALYVTGQRGAAAGDLGQPSRLSATGALRHLQELRRRGLVESEEEAVHFRLTARARAMLDGYFAG